MNSVKMTSLALGLVTLSACGAARPSKQLLDARAIVSQAQSGDAGRLAPDDLLEAKKLLDRAEKSDDGSANEIHFAYLADREARLASANGASKRAEREAREASDKYTMLQGQGRLNAEAALAQSQAERQRLSGNLSASEKARGESEKARLDAEARANAALASLNTLAAVKEEATETVITLSGQVLFKTNEATLLPIAERNLDQVAKALKELAADRTIVVQGHTDSRGDDEANRKLSEARAQAVMNYLVSQGVKGDRVSAIGMGESKPVASNESAEGRANNRRVELVVQKGPTKDSTVATKGTSSP